MDSSSRGTGDTLVQGLEHVYSIDPEKWPTYYYLLQIAFILTQLLERGSLLRQLAAGRGVRAFDPCLSCSTHAFGAMPLHLQLVGPDGQVIHELRRS